MSSERCFPRGIGLPLRPGLLPWIGKLQAAGLLAFCEVHLEALLQPSSAYLEYIDTLMNCGVDICVHSVGILPSTDFEPQLRALELLNAWCIPSLLSIHIASGYSTDLWGESFVRPRYSDALFKKMEQHLRELTAAVNIPVAVENIANYQLIEDGPSDELDFIGALAVANGVSVIFDVSNHLTTYGCSVDGVKTASSASLLPLKYVHISGGRWLRGRYFDTHADPMPDAHLKLCAELMLRTNVCPLYERDSGFDRHLEIECEIRNLLHIMEKNVEAGRYSEI